MSTAKGSCGHLFFAVMLTLALVASAAAQQTPFPRVDVYGGYSWLDPGGKVAGVELPGINQGAGATATLNINRIFGISGDLGVHRGDNANIYTLLFGPRLKFRSGDNQLVPFIEGLVGFARMSPAALPVTSTGLAFGAGGGLDLRLHKYVEWRVLRGDYIYQKHDDIRNLSPANTDDHFNGGRVQSGLLINFGGGKPAPPPTAACSLQPTEVMAGEPVTATVNTTNFNPKHTLTYNWTGTGGKVQGKQTSATVDTTGLAPGSYTVTARVADPKMKKGGEVSCNASFTVKEPPKHPPTMSCSASAATVRSGDSATITAQASSPDNRPLTYDWKASGGRISGTGATATLDTAGAPAGPITITGTVSDDRGLTANCSSTVNVEVPPPPPQASKLNEIAFKNNNARVDNTAKAILDDVALRLQRDADAKAVVVGYSDPAEKNGAQLAAQRGVNTKAYLTKEKGIDPSRIEVRTGTAGGTRAEVYLVPAGASFNQADTQTVDETKVKVAPTKRPVARRAAKKKPAAAPK
jgi:outer membrane protein OmpA-like peptidoglycan-associated protein